ncbi:MAG TPA: undecaprenyldiphospho-muramoylpentapeptide beta-N-acetylglucosaminyltransferase [Patescibacteria group bacterium]|nr:undecaprenyldiphospho-muramoylpentapeptide beta-N-acetylglucosaminyltransferase [Patescibacteria group bacterium]
MKVLKKIVLTGGGTAGHIRPTLSVADEIKKIDPEIEFIYIGLKSGMEAKIVSGTDFKFYGIHAGKIKRYWSGSNFLTPLVVILGFFESLSILLREKPQAIFAKGGYVTVPVAMAGWFLKIPILIHESDSVMGLSNKFLSRLAKKVATVFPASSYSKKIQPKIIWSGLPIKKEILNLQKNKAYQIFGLSDQIPITLVFGGSQGSFRINELILKNLKKLLSITQILHFTGVEDFERVNQKRKRLATELKERYQIFDFSEEIYYGLKAANLVIARAGASSLSEISAFGKASIIIPLPTSAANHQVSNAEIYREAKAAVVLKEENLSANSFLKKVQSLISRPFLLEQLGKNANSLYKANAATTIAKNVLDLIK